MADEQTALTPDNTVTDGAGSEVSFLDSITDESLKGNEAITSFQSLDDLLKDYVITKELIPKLPENEDGYVFETPEGVTLDETSFKAFQKTAHEIGLTADQFQALMKFDLGRQEAANKSVMEAEAAQKAKMEKAAAEIKKEFGAEFDAKLDGARKVLEKTGAVELANDPELGNSPAFFRHLVKISELISEDKLEAGTPGSGDQRPKDEFGRAILPFKM